MNIDESVAAELEDVDWRRVSEHQAQAVGTGLGMMHESQVASECYRQAFRSKLDLLIASIIVAFVAVLGFVPATACLIGIVAVVALSTAYSLFVHRTSSSLTATYRRLLISDVKELPREKEEDDDIRSVEDLFKQVSERE